MIFFDSLRHLINDDNSDNM